MSGHSAGEELPYIGSKISLISTSDIRYEGILDSIDPVASTVALRYVHSFGTEGRPVASPIPPSAEQYSCIVFHGKHIKDLTVCSEPEAPPPTIPGYPLDPAIVSVEMGGPPGAPQAQGLGNMLRPLGGPPHSVRGPAPPPTGVFGGLVGAPNEMADPCGAPTQPQAGGGFSQQHMQHRAAGGLSGGTLGSVGQLGEHQQQSFGGGRGGMGPRGTGRTPRGRGARDPRRLIREGGRGYELSGLVVGELEGRVNAQLKNEVAEEFDFDAMNSKFEKPAVLEDAPNLPTPGTAYDKNVSFFDSISCEALDKKEEQERRQNQGNAEDDRGGRRGSQRQNNRALDMDTFGENAAHYNMRHYHPRRGGRGRGRGGFLRETGPGAGRGGRGNGQRKWAQRGRPQGQES